MSKSKHVFYGYYPSEDAREIFFKSRSFGTISVFDNNLTAKESPGCGDVRYRITIEKAPLQRKPKRRMK